MKRIAIIAIAMALFISTASIAFAGDNDSHPDTEPSTDTDEARELSAAQARNALLLANYMITDYPLDEGTPTVLNEGAAALAGKELAALRTGDTVIGWGAMFKLLQLAKATNMTLSKLLDTFETDEGWGFGRLFKDLVDDQPALLEEGPKNLGQLKKQAREAGNEKESKGNNGKKP